MAKGSAGGVVTGFLGKKIEIIEPRTQYMLHNFLSPPENRLPVSYTYRIVRGTIKDPSLFTPKEKKIWLSRTGKKEDLERVIGTGTAITEEGTDKKIVPCFFMLGLKIRNEIFKEGTVIVLTAPKEGSAEFIKSIKLSRFIAMLK